MELHPLLNGARNFRAVLPYGTADGRRLRADFLFRSGELSRLDEADLPVLEGLNVRLVCDLRSSGEQSAYPTRWPGAAPRQLMLPGQARDDAGPMAIFQVISAHEGERGATLAMDRLYRRKPLIFAPVLRVLAGDIIAGGALPLLVHSGKDRTGFMVAMLLAMLGVSRDDIMADYALTARFFPPVEEIPQTISWARESYGHVLTAIQVKPLVEARPEYLAASFAEIEGTYGGMDAYISQHIGLDETAIANLREALLTQ
ncbi:MAG: tyrosine-protein phosphatase [Acidocella sp.]|nr:tyrosine-protein phosphatase [Acidocella sp.]